MDQRLNDTIAGLIDLSTALVETTLLLRDLVKPKPDYWRGLIESFIQEINKQWQAALERF